MKSFSQLTNPFRQVIINARKLLGIAWRMDKKVTFLYYLTAGIGALSALATSYMLKLLIDELQINQNLLPATIPIVLFVLLASQYVVNFLSEIIYWSINQSYLDYIFRYKLQNTITLKFHKKIAALDIAHFEDSKTQDLITKTRDTMQWRLPDYLRSLHYLMRDTIGFFAAFFVLIPYGWWIPVVVSVVSIPRLYLQARYGAIQWSIWGSGAPQAKKLWYLNYLLQEPTTVKETRISLANSALMTKFESIQKYLFNLSKSALDKYLKVSIFPPIFEGIVIFLIAAQFMGPVLASIMSIGSFTLLISMLAQLGGRSANISSTFASLYESSLYVNHYFDFLALPKLLPPPKKPVVLSDIKPVTIEFRNVTFNYANGPKVLDNVSFTIEAGKNVAFVGHNGAGKTTIVKLICRFYDVTSGEILIDGINIKELDLTSWYKHIGTLFQEFVRYHFTVRENICIGNPKNVDDSAMKAAAVYSGADEFIQQLPKKYDQMLGKEFEDGEELSGGQWQKIAIARAFYEQPPILILDEPTSAIDAEAEYNIFRNLASKYKNKTLILVSHRFSTVRNADKIIVIEKGKVKETGTHEELMTLGKNYSKLFTLQAKGYQ